MQGVYASDIARLASLEEAGFLLGIDGRVDCPVCGAPPDAQVHTHGLAEIDEVRVAAEIEIQKITQQRSELIATVQDTRSGAANLVAYIATLAG